MKRSVCLLLGLMTLLVVVCCIGVFAIDEEPSLEIHAKALDLEATVGLAFAVPTEPAKGAEVELLVWTSPRTDEYLFGTHNYALAPSDEDTVNDVECTVFIYDGLAAKQMGDTVYVRAYAKVDGIAYYSEVEKYSILQYAYNKLGKTEAPTEDEALKATLTAMLEYGASAQALFDYKTDRLVTAEFYQVSVEGGYIVTDLSHEGLYLKDEQVTFTAYAENEESLPFSHWENAFGEAVGEERQLTVTVGESNAKYRAVYREALPEPPATQQVSVSVIDGSVTNASDDGSYEVGATIELVANENEAACFAYWKNGAGEILSEDSTYSVTVGAEEETYTAVYATPYEYFYFEVYTASSWMVSFDPNKSSSCPEDIIVPRFYQGKPVAAIASNGFKNLNTIKTVLLPRSIISLSTKSFYQCSALKSVTMEYCTQMIIVSKHAFYECTALNTVTLPQSLTKIESQAFYKCSSLNAIAIPENVNYIDAYAFYLCSNLTAVEFKDPSGWQFESTLLDALLLADPAEAAGLLTKTYNDAVWEKND